MKNLYSRDVNQSVVDNLISGTLVPCKVVAAALETGAGVVKRGTPVSSVDGEIYKVYDGTGDIHGILLLDVDTADEDECLGPVAFGGEFNQNKIEEVTGLTLTPLVIANARARQIFIAPMEKAPEAYEVI